MALRPRLASLLLLGSAVVPAFAADDAFEFYKEEAQVVTASRRAEPAWLAPASVDVVTADDIRAYGFKDIWDALRFRAGMNVIDGRSLDGNRQLISMRGFDNEYVAEMQVLVDGRSVYSPFLGGVYWQSVPVQMQDIERIEIVRGPNAALYGSNAGFGVINIITKKPGSAASGEASSWGGSRGAVAAAAAAEAGAASSGLRVSYDYRADEGHPRADGAADDFFRENKLNVRGRWSPDARTELELLGGGSWEAAGIPGVPTDPQARQAQNFQMAKAERRLDGGSTLAASLSRSETNLSFAPVFAGDVAVRTYTYDGEVLHSFSWLDERVKSSWGANWRESGADSNQTFGSPYQDNRLVRGFTHHSVRVSDFATLVGGISLEDSSTGGSQVAGQAAFLLSPTESDSFRLSYSRAPTIPPLMEQHARYALAPGEFYVGNPSFAPQKITSWEAGWNGRFADGALKTGVSLYYMRIDAFSVVSPSFSGGNRILQSINSGRAYARGVELSADYALGRAAAVFANYTFEDITTDYGRWVTGLDPARTTPRHAFNVGGRTSLPRGFAFSSVLGYKDDYMSSSITRGTNASIPRHFRLDARLSWSPRPGWELFVAGQELLQPAFAEYVDGTATPRTVRGGVEVRLGR